MSKYEGHTPGPWTTLGTSRHIFRESNGFAIGTTITYPETPESKKADEANAKLIADAPLLAEQNAKMLAFIKFARDMSAKDSAIQDEALTLLEWINMDAGNLIAEIER